jgi:hypothetical protein
MFSSSELFETLGGVEEPLVNVAGNGSMKDPVATGIHIRNSDIDAFSFQVDLMTFRLVCTNGLMGWVPKALFKKSRQWGDILMFRDSCKEALEEIEQLRVRSLAQMRASRQKVYDDTRREHERIVKAFFRSYNLIGRGYLDDVLMRWEKFPSGEPSDPDRPHQYTKFGLVDSVTRVAQTLSFEEKHKWEVSAGKFLAAR